MTFQTYFQIALFFPSFTFDAFPMVFIGACALFAGSLALFLPETLGEPLVESVSDVDKLGGENGKAFGSWWSKERLQRHVEHHRQIDAKP